MIKQRRTTENMHGRGRPFSRVLALMSMVITLLAVVALFATGCGDDEIEANTSANPGKLVLTETEYDFGAVPVGQEVAHDFTVSNDGSGTLNLGEPDVKLLEGC